MILCKSFSVYLIEIKIKTEKSKAKISQNLVLVSIIRVFGQKNHKVYSS